MRLGSLAIVIATGLASAASGQPDSAPLDALFDASGETRAAMLISGGRVEQKRYAPGYSDANRFISWSMAKTITALLVGELVTDGRLALDAPAPVAEWQGAGDPRGAITLRQLLHMASGLKHTEVGQPVENSDTNQATFVRGTAAMAAYAIAQPLDVMPGTRFEYNTLTSVILAEIVTRTLTPSRDPEVRATAYRDFAQSRVFAPAGVRSAFLEFDGAGTQVGGSIIHMTLDDWGRMGRVLLAGRGPGGEVVIAPEWLAFIKAPSPRNPQYGGQLWLNRRPLPGSNPVLFPGQGPDTTVSMNGHLGQYVVAAGDARGDVVVVRLGNTPDGDDDRVMAHIGRIVERRLPRAGSAPR